MTIFERVLSDFQECRDLPDYEKSHSLIVSFLNRDFNDLIQDEIPEQLLRDYCAGYVYSLDSKTIDHNAHVFYELGSIYSKIKSTTNANANKRIFI